MWCIPSQQTIIVQEFAHHRQIKSTHCCVHEDWIDILCMNLAKKLEIGTIFGTVQEETEDAHQKHSLTASTPTTNMTSSKRQEFWINYMQITHENLPRGGDQRPPSLLLSLLSLACSILSLLPMKLEPSRSWGVRRDLNQQQKNFYAAKSTISFFDIVWICHIMCNCSNLNSILGILAIIKLSKAIAPFVLQKVQGFSDQNTHNRTIKSSN